MSILEEVKSLGKLSDSDDEDNSGAPLVGRADDADLNSGDSSNLPSEGEEEGDEEDGDEDFGELTAPKTPAHKLSRTNSVKGMSSLELSSTKSHEIKEEAAPVYNKVIIDTVVESSNVSETKTAAASLIKALKLRKKYAWARTQDTTRVVFGKNPHWAAPETDATIRAAEHKAALSSESLSLVNGVFQVTFPYDPADPNREALKARPRSEYGADLKTLMTVVNDPPTRTVCYNRLHMLEARFKLHHNLNNHVELHAQRSVSHRDFYNVRKVDNHVHHSACMNQKHLLRFIKNKLKSCGDDKVIIIDGKETSLANVFAKMNLTAYDLNVDSLDCKAYNVYKRFDRFNKKYNPLASQYLREIFLKYNNHIKGRYLAELTKEVMLDMETNKYQLAEYRLSIYGKNANEWDILSAWVVDNELFSKEVGWMIQIPRLYAIYKKAGLLDNFAQMLDNIFRPLFEVTRDPASHPKLHIFLEKLHGFDSVDDESIREKPYNEDSPMPEEWNTPVDPCYAMFAYYVHANLTVLNKYRASKGLSTFTYRPHAGEAGDIEHLASTFLLANSINHGILLKRSPTLQYLYYLSQIGLSMSPLSNNALFLKLDQSPFRRFFFRGLNVTLSTDDPLMIHVTKEPLVEEYSVAAQIWKFTAVDMCEIARNSVLQSNFEHNRKAHWIGNGYYKLSVQGNDIRQSNVPNVRVAFRLDLLHSEYAWISDYAGEEMIARDYVRG